MAVVHELFADVFGSHIGKHSERLMYTKGKTVLAQAPLMHLERVTVASMGVSISADAIAACCERGIPIFFIDPYGEPFAMLHAPALAGTVLTRRAQLAAYYDGRGAAISLAIASAKINNQVATLKYVAKSRKESDPELFNALRDASVEVEQYADRLNGLRHLPLEELRAPLMAFEANAATRYWAALRRVVPDVYGWANRTGRGATDPVNSLLNYGYAILAHRVQNAVMVAGLDPFAGFLHADRPGKLSLIYDVMEEFRSVATDRLVVGLVNRKYTVKMNERGQLEDEVKRDYADKVTQHLKATVRYAGERFPIEQVIGKQARRLAAHLRGETEAYLPYRAEW